MNRPDLGVEVARYQAALRLLDWRITVAYVPNLCNDEGAPVWGLCSPVIDNKTATIQIRDPMTPPPGESVDSASKQVIETIVHELVHLHFAPFGLRAPSEIAAEEQAVWAISEALVSARDTPQEAMIAKAMRARIAQSLAPRRARIGGQMDPQMLKEALDAIEQGDAAKATEILKGLIVSAASGGAAPPSDAPMGEPDGDEPAPAEAKPGAAPPPGGAAPMGDPAMKARVASSDIAKHEARARVASATLTSNAIRSMVHSARVIDGLALPPAVEKRILGCDSIEAAQSHLDTARETLAANPAAGTARERTGAGAGNAGGDKVDPLDGLKDHEKAAYHGMVSDGRTAQAATYLKSAQRNRSRLALVSNGGVK